MVSLSVAAADEWRQRVSTNRSGRITFRQTARQNDTVMASGARPVPFLGVLGEFLAVGRGDGGSHRPALPSEGFGFFTLRPTIEMRKYTRCRIIRACGPRTTHRAQLSPPPPMKC